MTEPTAAVWSLPTDIAEFGNDERISFSRLDNKHIAVQDDGSEYEFDTALRRWIPMLDDDLIAAQQSAYFNSISDQSPDARPGKKRKQDEDQNSGNKRGNKRRAANGAGPPAPKQNTAIYVTGLPLDVTADEVAELFSRKCGVIAEEIDSGRPRVKLYTDEAGNFKGDALVVFFKPQSVDMAIMLLDDTPFRFSASGLGSGRMRVQPADSSYKKTNYAEDGGGGTSGGGGGGNKAESSDRSRRGGNDAEKQKIIKKTQKLDAKLADWSDDEPYPLPYETEAGKGSKWDKLVILKHMFTLQELEDDPAALLDIKEDIRDECAKLGEVTNVILFDEEESGVVSVKFRKAEAAEACVQLMGGRAFDGRTVEASIATGREKYKKSKKDDDLGDEEEE